MNPLNRKMFRVVALGERSCIIFEMYIFDKTKETIKYICKISGSSVPFTNEGLTKKAPVFFNRTFESKRAAKKYASKKYNKVNYSELPTKRFELLKLL